MLFLAALSPHLALLRFALRIATTLRLQFIPYPISRLPPSQPNLSHPFLTRAVTCLPLHLSLPLAALPPPSSYCREGGGRECSLDQFTTTFIRFGGEYLHFSSSSCVNSLSIISNSGETIALSYRVDTSG